ncbi:MAG: hypothetical protein ACTSXA_13210 [Candidatus Heimdallarchaeota archaeon]
MQASESSTKKEKRIFNRQLRISNRHERFYKSNFIMFEIGYVLLAIPMLVLALSSVPILMFYTLTQEFHLWPIIIVCILVVFTQITAMQYFVRKYYLNYHKMSLGQFFRYRFDLRRKRINKGDQEEFYYEETWYEDLDEMIERVKNKRQEQTIRIYTQAYGNIVD